MINLAPKLPFLQLPKERFPLKIQEYATQKTSRQENASKEIRRDSERIYKKKRWDVRGMWE